MSASPAHLLFKELLTSAVAGTPARPADVAPLDWEEAGELIRAHHLTSVAEKPARQAGAPAPLLADLEERALRERRRTAVMMLELRRALQALEAVGAAPLVLKGAALAVTEAVPRGFSDLDVLVPRAAMPEATRALEGIGFVPHQTSRDRSFYERHHFHSVLRSRSEITLELHWGLARPSDYFRLEPQDFLARSRTVPFDGISMRVPSDGDQLLHAAAQSLREGFSAGRRVIDAARILRRPGLEPDLPERARTARLQTGLWILLRLCQDLAGVTSDRLQAAVLPSPPRRTCLAALDLPGILIDRQALFSPGLKRWLLLVAAPDARTTAATFAGATFPGERGLLEDGHRPDALPGPFRRSVLSAKRVGQTAGIAVYQLWRLGGLFLSGR